MGIQILNVLGQVVHNETVNFSGDMTRYFNTRHLLSEGVYILQIKAVGTTIQKKIVVH